MLFSILTVSYNNLSGLKKTYASLNSQISRDFEWIIVDGGSTDGSAEFLEAIKAHFTSAPDKGIYDAMNKGLKRACGDYILFLNAGDCLTEPGTLQKIAAALENAEDGRPDFIYGDSLEEITHNKKLCKLYKKARSHKYYRQNMITHHQAMLYRRETLKDLRYDLSYKIAADFDFTARFLASIDQTGKVLYLSFPLCIFEAGGLSQSNMKQGRQEQFLIRKKQGLMSLPLNILFYITQSFAGYGRKLFPNFYWRFKKGF